MYQIELSKNCTFHTMGSSLDVERFGKTLTSCSLSSPPSPSSSSSSLSSSSVAALLKVGLSACCGGDMSILLSCRSLRHHIQQIRTAHCMKDRYGQYYLQTSYTYPSPRLLYVNLSQELITQDPTGPSQLLMTDFINARTKI